MAGFQDYVFDFWRRLQYGRVLRLNARLSAEFHNGLRGAFAELYEQAGLNQSARYHELMQADPDRTIARILPALRRYRIVFVPGFLSELLIASDKHEAVRGVTRFTRLGVYFDEQIEWLRSVPGGRLDVTRLKIESAALPEVNARIIASAILESKKPVLIVAHSKGGIDTLECLIERGRVPRLRSKLARKIAGIITIQSPFFGSPVAGFLLANQLVRHLTQYSLEQLGGTGGALDTLTRRVRCQAYNENRPALATLLQRIPLLCFGSYVQREEGRANTFLLLEESRNRMERLGIRNDGLVPLHSAILPGSAYVEAGEVDHAVTVMPALFLEFDRKAFIAALLTIIVERMEVFRKTGRMRRAPKLPGLSCLPPL